MNFWSHKLSSDVALCCIPSENSLEQQKWAKDDVLQNSTVLMQNVPPWDGVSREGRAFCFRILFQYVKHRTSEEGKVVTHLWSEELLLSLNLLLLSCSHVLQFGQRHVHAGRGHLKTSFDDNMWKSINQLQFNLYRYLQKSIGVIV